ncbi:chemotaxis protein CheD [Pueribacillus theae]|uniref:Probable chemoreceptor glutamine deamidase CheD n=1 Tax=Pueribacillus theae TaxID=2171751 RepID=A0A2U1K7M8_9BACI|nr:chemotaxis protein CheD [Pueribacillus theae]PWA13527.1 chemotaxis protein CheD [Pueribacillus theae]
MSEMLQVVKVGLAEIKTVSPPNTIRTSGLGSCVGVVVYNEVLRIAGMAHVMLPDSGLAREKNFRHGKYADTAVEALYHRLKEHHNVYPLKAKIAGGAQMFQFKSDMDLMRIGHRNVLAVKEHLKKFKIELIAEDVGGNSGRTIEFDPETSILTVRKVNAGMSEI